jgi:hypothetical protein
LNNNAREIEQMDDKVAQALEIASKCPHNVAQARGPKIRPNLGASSSSAASKNGAISWPAT